MIRFRVVKGSHILLGLSILALAVVLAVILLGSTAAGGKSAPVSTRNMEAKVIETFASDDLAEGLQINVIPDPLPSETPRNGKSILIYHTHTHEAYSQMDDDPYVAVETWRTEDMEHSVVRLGSALRQELETFGYEVVHDQTDHEQRDINSSYVRSLETLEGYSEEFDLTIDLHRDAYVESLDKYYTDGDKEYAQLMLLVGRGDAYDGDEKPDYEGNLYFAQQLTRFMNEELPGICRNVTVKKGRYNQHIGERAILIEVGHNLNTLPQALNSIPCLARAIDKTLRQND